MKRNKLTILFAVLMSTIGIKAYAYDFEVDDLYYDIVSASDMTCKLVGKTANAGKDLVIPPNIVYNGKTLKVVSIGSNALGSLNSLKLPNSIKTIEKNGGYTIIKLYVESLEDWLNISFSSYPFSQVNEFYCNGKLCTDLVIPESINEIKPYSFYGFKSITSVTIGAKSVGTGAFMGCSNLKNIYATGSVSFKKDALDLGCSLSSINFIGGANFTTGNKLPIFTTKNAYTSWLGFYGYYYDSYDNYRYNKTKLENNSSVPTFGEPMENWTILSNAKSISSPLSTVIENVVIEDASEPLNLGYQFYKYMTSSINSSVYGYAYFGFFSGGEISNLYIGRPVVGGYSDCKAARPFDKCHIYNLSINNMNKDDFVNLGIYSNFQYDFTTSQSTGTYFHTYYSDYNYSYLKTLTLGKDLSKSSGKFDFTWFTKLEKVTVLSEDPWFIDASFTDKVYVTAKLVVPKGCKEKYEAATPWKNFWNIEEMEQDVTDLKTEAVSKANNTGKISYYSISGLKRDSPQKGINIIKNSDGTTKKVIIK